MKNILTNKGEIISYTKNFHENMHNATAITTGSANQRSNTPCIRLWIDVTFRGLEDSYIFILFLQFLFVLLSLFVYLFIYLIIYMYLLSCPSLLFSLSTCIFCPIIKYICKHTLYEVLLNSNMKSILKRIHSYIRF